MQPQQNSELDPNSYPHPVSSDENHQFESQMMSQQMQRPNSIEVCIFLLKVMYFQKTRQIKI